MITEILNSFFLATNQRFDRSYNQTDSADSDEKERILNELLGGKGKNL